MLIHLLSSHWTSLVASKINALQTCKIIQYSYHYSLVWAEILAKSDDTEYWRECVLEQKL